MQMQVGESKVDTKELAKEVPKINFLKEALSSYLLLKILTTLAILAFIIFVPITVHKLITAHTSTPGHTEHHTYGPFSDIQSEMNQWIKAIHSEKNDTDNPNKIKMANFTHERTNEILIPVLCTIAILFFIIAVSYFVYSDASSDEEEMKRESQLDLLQTV